MEKVLYYKIEVDTGDANRKLLGEMTAQLKVLNDEYKKLISSKEKDVAAIGRNREQVLALTKDINNLSKSIVSSTAASEKDAADKIKFANDVKNANNKLEQAYIQSEAKKAAAAEREALVIKNAQNRLEEAYAKAEAKREAKIQANTFEAGSIAALRQELSKATMAYDRMGEAERNSAAGKQLEISIAGQVQALNKLEQATGRFQRQVGNYNTAGVAMSQVLREIPAFTFSAQTGILALSNNIPILVDEMKRIATSIDSVTGKKAGWKGALKEMGANLFSLGGVMTIALGLFTIFSKQIFDFIGGEKKATEAISEHERAQRELNKAMEEYNRLIENQKDYKDLSQVIGLLGTNGDLARVSIRDLEAALSDLKQGLSNLSKENVFLLPIDGETSEQEAKRRDAEYLRSKLNYEKNIALLEDYLNTRRGKNKADRANNKKEKEVELKEQLSLQNEIYQALIDQMREGEEKKLEEEKLRWKIELEETKKFYNDGVHTKLEVDVLIIELERKHQKNLDDIIREAREKREQERLKGLESVKKTLDDYDKYLEEKQKKEDDKKIQAEKEYQDELKALKNRSWGYLTEAENLYFKLQEDALQRHLKRQMRAIEQDSARQTDILKNRLDKGLISEAQYNADKAELDRQAEEKRFAAEKQAFEKQKRLAQAKIAVDTAVAIMRIWASSPNVYLGAVESAIVAGLGAAQIAAVNAQEFAEGGLVLDKNKNIPTKPNGDSVLTTLTPGEIVLNKQQQAMLGGNETFARIGVPNVPSIYPNSASGGSVSTVSKKDFQMMFNNLGNTINSKKVYQLESEAKRTRNTVENYETSNKW